MKIATIYLDQFAISNMADNNNNNWDAIKIAINELIEKKNVVCTTSIESTFETSMRNKTGAHKNFDFISNFTQNKYLRNFKDIVSMQIASVIKKEKYTFDDYTIQVEHNFKETEKLENNKNQFDCYKKNYNDSFNVVKDEFSEIKELVKNNSTLIHQYLYDIEVNNFKDAISNKIPSYMHSNIISFLQNNMNFTLQDFQLLYDELNLNGFNNIPSLYIHTKLSAYIFTMFSKNIVNDMIDIRRISVSLPICDIITCDNAWKNKIIELELNKKYNALIISGKDTIELENKLNRLSFL